ncbi:MAG: hypothetical protein PHC29_04715 [Candidatus Omnitrophica bacterium]|nr:hypothetical protein [Candidatus Omnitrophota bacterium]
MEKNKTFYLSLFLLSFAAIFISGCVYFTHLDEVRFMKNLEANQKAMKAELDKQENLYNKLKTDIDNGRLNELTEKSKILKIYGEPVLCRPPLKQDGIRETCIYRNPTGGLILLNFDTQDKLISWQIQNP